MTELSTTRPLGDTADTVADILAPFAQHCSARMRPIALRTWDGTASRSGRCAAHDRRAVPARLAAPPVGTGRARPGPGLRGRRARCRRRLSRCSCGSATGSRPQSARRRRLAEAETTAALLRAARRLGVIGRPLAAAARGGPPPRPPPHPARDAAAVSHHYDVGNEFYRLRARPER